jgi:hypothetical protein
VTTLSSYAKGKSSASAAEVPAEPRERNHVRKGGKERGKSTEPRPTEQPQRTVINNDDDHELSLEAEKHQEIWAAAPASTLHKQRQGKGSPYHTTGSFVFLHDPLPPNTNLDPP